MAVAYSSGDILFVNPKTAETLFKLRMCGVILGRDGGVSSVVFGHDGNSLYVADENNRIAKLNVDTRKEEVSWDTTKSAKKQAAVSILSITHNDKYLIGAIKSRVKLWSLATTVPFKPQP